MVRIVIGRPRKTKSDQGKDLKSKGIDRPVTHNSEGQGVVLLCLYFIFSAFREDSVCMDEDPSTKKTPRK